MVRLIPLSFYLSFSQQEMAKENKMDIILQQLLEGKKGSKVK